jgi:hypothetical protein
MRRPWTTRAELRERLEAVEGRQDEVLTALGMMGAILTELPPPRGDTPPEAASEPPD